MRFLRLKPSRAIWMLAIGLLMTARLGAAQDLIVARTLIEDPSGSLTINDVEQWAGTPVGPDLKTGSSEWVHWLRLKVHAPAHGSRLVLFLRPSYLNEVRVYEPDADHPGAWKTRVTGNHYPYATRDRASTSLSFVVTSAGSESTYYLRIHAKNTFSLQIQALEPEEADRKDHSRDLLEVFFVTAMGFFLIWALHSYFLDRQTVVGWFAVHQAAYTLFGIQVTGYLAPLNLPFFPRYVDWINSIFYLLINFTLMLFCRDLFKPYRPPAPVQRILNVMPWSFPVLLLGSATGYDNVAIFTNSVLIKLSLLFYLVTSFLLRVERVPRRRVLQAFFLAIMVFNLLFWYAGAFTPLARRVNLSAIQTLVFDGLIVAALFAWVLHANARQILREGHESAMQLMLVQKKFELAQELKKQLEIQAQTDCLTGIYNRRRFLEVAESEVSRSIRYGHPLSLLVIDIDHFKRINDAWGHAAGDVALMRICDLVRETLRCNDVFARTGGEEFGAVLPETSEDEASHVAQRICSTVAGAMIAVSETQNVRVSVSIGLASVNERSISLDSLIDEADRAMYAAKEAGRNCVRIHGHGIHSTATLN